MKKLNIGVVGYGFMPALMTADSFSASCLPCRRAKTDGHLFGTARQHRDRVAELSMQRQAYQDKLKEAAEVLQQAPGAAPGNAIGDAAEAVATA